MNETLTISGSAVSCARCLAMITDGLNAQEGVINVSADKKNGILQVDYDPKVIDENGIRGKLRAIGFMRDSLYCIC